MNMLSEWNLFICRGLTVVKEILTEVQALAESGTDSFEESW